ncbi:P-loop containing nucleoside triphosphate hydrolase protein [Xylaria venustula]|nr:P-loop containing nucleoside triphosphate hydrolase protein [Xylaria venustula]
MTEQQHQRAAAAKTSAEWHRKVKTELFTRLTVKKAGHRNRQKSTNTISRWNPYGKFYKQEDVKKFYSGHTYRRHFLVDRERYAKFAIQTTLDGYPDDDYETTVELLKNESIVNQSADSGVLENLENAIRADGQQDVDAEVPNEFTTRSSKAEDNDFTQKISAAAQSIIAASPNSLGPPVNPCAAYLMMTKCGQYGRSNSTIWKSPLMPNLDNEDGRRGLLDHQVTAIVWLLSRLFGDLPILKYEDPSGKLISNSKNFSDLDRSRLKGPRYFGGILADSMGLGKTLITVALVGLLISQELLVERTEDGITKHRPTLLVAPNATVANQWVEEFTQVIGKSTLRVIVISGQGRGRKVANYRERVIPLERDEMESWPDYLSYMWNQDNPEASKVILIMTMDTWSSRTCSYDEEKKMWRSTFTEKKREFSLVIVDEAHKVKNFRTKYWRSVYLLERQFTLLITATPCLNSVTDLFALGKLLWTAPNVYLEKDPEEWEKITGIFNELQSLDILNDYPSSHDYQLVAGWPSMLAQILYKHRDSKTHDIDLTRQHLRHFERLSMLKRSPSSYIYADWDMKNPISLEGLFPKVENCTVDINPGEGYNEEYQRVHMDLLIGYLEKLSTWGAVVAKGRKKLKTEENDARKPIMNSIRLLQIASSSLDVYDLDTILSANKHSTLSTEVATMRENGVHFRRLAQFLILPTENQPETHLDYMAIATRNSPILRYILRYIEERILTRQKNDRIKKLLIIEHNPMVAFYYELVLQFLGFECRCMHAQLSLDERQSLVDSFNSSHDESCQILIQMYTVGFAGTNLHKSCSQVLVVSQSHSLQVQWQAIHRVIRVGQKSDVTVHRVKLKNSYHAFRESRQIEKILPEMGARAHGNTKKVLVLLLNLFQHEIDKAWHSLEGQRLRKERNLLDDDTDEEEEEEQLTEVPSHKRIKLDEQEPRPGDGSGGWFNQCEPEDDDTVFLEMRTRDQYYEEFISLPQEAKSVFNHSKNNLRRLMTYGNDNGTLRTRPWTEDDLEDVPVLERALELMLRVRLGAKDIAMLPFPMIDLSGAPAHLRARLQQLLAETKHTDQDLSGDATSSAGKDPRETMRGTDLNKSLTQIDEDIEQQIYYGE